MEATGKSSAKRVMLAVSGVGAMHGSSSGQAVSISGEQDWFSVLLEEN